MQVTVEDVSSVKKTLQVEIPQEDVTREIDAAYNKLKKTAKVKGFRPGKTPRSTLERLFKKDVHADVVSTLVQNTFPDAVKEVDLTVLDTSEIDTPELDPQSAYTYRATVELKPELPEVQYNGLNLKKTTYTVDDEEVDNQLNMLRKHLAKHNTVTDGRAAAKDDMAIIDYEGRQNGQPFEATPRTENYSVKLGHSGMTDAFDEAIIGMKAGEQKEFTVAFPDDYSNQELAGQEVTFSVFLKEIQEEVLPPVDDNLAKELGKFTNLDELKAEIRKNLQEGYDKRVQQELHEQIFDQLLTEEFEIPEVLVKVELDEIVRDAEMRFAQSGMSLEQVGLSRDIMEQQYRQVAEKQVRRHLLLSKIIEQDNLDVTDEEINAEYEKIAASMNQPVDLIKGYYKQNPDKQDGFKHALLEKKAIDIIVNVANIEEVEPTVTRSEDAAEDAENE